MFHIFPNLKKCLFFVTFCSTAVATWDFSDVPWKELLSFLVLQHSVLCNWWQCRNLPHCLVCLSTSIHPIFILLFSQSCWHACFSLTNSYSHSSVNYIWLRENDWHKVRSWTPSLHRDLNQGLPLSSYSNTSIPDLHCNSQYSSKPSLVSGKWHDIISCFKKKFAREVVLFKCSFYKEQQQQNIMLWSRNMSLCGTPIQSWPRKAGSSKVC